MKIVKTAFATTVLVGSLLSLSVLAALPAQAETGPTMVLQQARNQIVVQGQAELWVTPDRVKITVHLQEREPSVQKAKMMVDQKTQSIREYLKGVKVQAGSLDSTAYSIYPIYEPKTEQLTGYQVSREVSFILATDVEPFKIIDALTARGITGIDQQYFLADPDKQYLQVMALAVKNGQQKAKHLAELNQIQLGKVINLQEQGYYQPRVQRMAMAKAEGASGMDIGQMQIQAQLEMTFAIQP